MCMDVLLQPEFLITAVKQVISGHPLLAKGLIYRCGGVSQHLNLPASYTMNIRV